MWWNVDPSRAELSSRIFVFFVFDIFSVIFLFIFWLIRAVFGDGVFVSQMRPGSSGQYRRCPKVPTELFESSYCRLEMKILECEIKKENSIFLKTEIFNKLFNEKTAMQNYSENQYGKFEKKNEN